MRSYPEFLGFKAASYPGQPPPRPILYEPRRLDLPPGFENDWKKIKTKRKPIIVLEGNSDLAKGPQDFNEDLTKVDI